MMDELALKPTENVKKSFTSLDNLRQQSPFLPTYIEWLWKHGEQIHEYVFIQAGTSSTTFYTVPEGYTLFITSANCSLTSLAGISASFLGGLLIYMGMDLKFLLCCPSVVSVGTDTISNQNISFTIPFKVISGKRIRGYKSTAATELMASFSGFLISNNLIPQF